VEEDSKGSRDSQRAAELMLMMMNAKILIYFSKQLVSLQNVLK
jgi:hypothetical protein